MATTRRPAVKGNVRFTNVSSLVLRHLVAAAAVDNAAIALGLPSGLRSVLTVVCLLSRWHLHARRRRRSR